jgi:hypothetical protein
MTPQEYTQAIELKTAQKRALLASADALIQSGNDWISQANSTSCNQSLSKNRTACEDEKKRKLQLGQSYLDQATAKQAEASRLTIEIDSLIKQREESSQSSNAVSQILATQGLTQTALDIKADAEGKAIVESSQIKAGAEAQAISENAKVDADAKKKILYIGIAVAVVIVLVVGAILYKKFKK